jgi:FkbM family methyltransferase
VKLAAAPLVAVAYHFERWPISLQRGGIFVTSKDLSQEIKAIESVFGRRRYGVEYGGAAVVDIGAYKGFFGAYALERGASRVVSYEPAEGNFDLLDRTAACYRKQGLSWSTHRAAVGSRDGSGVLHLARASLDHSLVPRAGGLDRVSIPVTSMSGVLSALGGRIIVKINAEGSECDIILGTPLGLWQGVEEVLIAMHSHAPCTLEDLRAYLHLAGLKKAGTRGPVTRFARTR